MTPETRVYLISDPEKRGKVVSQHWHDFSAEYWIQWDDGTRELHTAETIARMPVSHRKRRK